MEGLHSTNAAKILAALPAQTFVWTTTTKERRTNDRMNVQAVLLKEIVSGLTEFIEWILFISYFFQPSPANSIPELVFCLIFQ